MFKVRNLIMVLVVVALALMLVAPMVNGGEKRVIIHHESQGKGDPSWTKCMPESAWNGHKHHEGDWKGAECGDPDPTSVPPTTEPTKVKPTEVPPTATKVNPTEPPKPTATQPGPQPTATSVPQSTPTDVPQVTPTRGVPTDVPHTKQTPVPTIQVTPVMTYTAIPTIVKLPSEVTCPTTCCACCGGVTVNNVITNTGVMTNVVIYQFVIVTNPKN